MTFNNSKMILKCTIIYAHSLPYNYLKNRLRKHSHASAVALLVRASRVKSVLNSMFFKINILGAFVPFQTIVKGVGG